jgi:hypothetical protein
MDLTHHALRAGHTAASPAGRLPAVLLAGGGGTLGAAVLEGLLGSRAFAPVKVLAATDFGATIAGLLPLPFDAGELDIAPLPGSAPLADLGVVVFDRERHANGRDAAFHRPLPQQLPRLARWLYARGLRDLLVVMPHAAASLPAALRAGLASLDEQALASTGFERLVLLRSAAAPAHSSALGLQRLADLVLAQLRFMVPQNLQPVRAAKIAQLAVAIARQLPASRPATRVMPPELVWQAAQCADPAGLAQAWLRDQALPEAALQPQRM